MLIDYRSLPKALQAQIRRLAGHPANRDRPVRGHESGRGKPAASTNPAVPVAIQYPWSIRVCDLHGWGWMAPDEVKCVFCDRTLDRCCDRDLD
jgi:hypothetical protein